MKKSSILFLIVIALTSTSLFGNSSYMVLEKPSSNEIRWKGVKSDNKWIPLNKGDNLDKEDSLVIVPNSCVWIVNPYDSKAYSITMNGTWQVGSVMDKASVSKITAYARELVNVYRNIFIVDEPVSTGGTVVYKSVEFLSDIRSSLIQSLSGLASPQNMEEVFRSLPLTADSPISLLYYDKLSGKNIDSFFDATRVGLRIQNQSDTAFFVGIYDVTNDSIQLLPDYLGMLIPGKAIIDVSNVSLPSMAYRGDSLLVIAYPFPFDCEKLFSNPNLDIDKTNTTTLYQTLFNKILLK